MASGYGTCAEGTPDLMEAVSVNGDGGLRGKMGVYVPLGSCEADTPVLFLLCKKCVCFARQHLLYHTTPPTPTPARYEHK